MQKPTKAREEGAEHAAYRTGLSAEFPAQYGLSREWLAADDSAALWQLHSKHAKTSSDRHARRGPDHGAVQKHTHGVEAAPASSVFHAQHDRHDGSRRLQCARAVL